MNSGLKSILRTAKIVPEPDVEVEVEVEKPYKKKAIPAALRQQVWILKMGKCFQGKCKTTWCMNQITVYSFEAGHNIPESKGGTTDIENLIPICRQCNMSMSNTYTFDEWCMFSRGVKSVHFTQCYQFFLPCRPRS